MSYLSSFFSNKNQLWNIIYLGALSINKCWFFLDTVYIDTFIKLWASSIPESSCKWLCIKYCLSENSDMENKTWTISPSSLGYRNCKMFLFPLLCLCTLQRYSAATFSSVVNELQCNLLVFRFLFSLWSQCTDFLISFLICKNKN